MAYGNFKAYEGTLSGSEDFTFPWNAYRVVLTNDSASQDISFTITGNEGTLLPTETFSASMRIKGLTLSGLGDYRLWIWG